MADYTDFNLQNNILAERKIQVTYADISGIDPDDPDWEPEWAVLGRGVEDSSLELNPSVTTVTDILGITDTRIDKYEVTQSFDPSTLRGGEAFLHWMADKVIKGERATLRANILTIFGYYGTAGSYRARVDKNCTIEPTSLGGSGYVDAPFVLHYSQEIIHGTVNSMTNPTFTPAVAA
jgi:hypothetical protein